VGDTAGGGPLSTEGLAGIHTRDEFLDRLSKAKAAAGISLTAVPGLSKSKVERLLKGTIDAERLAFFLTALAVPGPEQWQWAEAWSRSTGTVVAPPAPGARRLQDWTPKLLGIHDAIDRRWPTYVPRRHDTDLRRHLRRAAASGGFVVLFGESCSGKAYYDERGKPMRASTQVSDPEFADRYIAQTRALLAAQEGGTGESPLTPSRMRSAMRPPMSCRAPTWSGVRGSRT